MSIEAATYINDLQPVNPPSSDPRSQGDDHLRLIKQVLQNSIVGSSRQFQIPSTLSKSANYSVQKADGESVIYANTGGGAVTFTLPTLVSGDAGWKVHFIKTSSDANPMFIAPSSGTINSGGRSGLSQCRRCIPGVKITAVWDGTAFFVTRALALPIGTLLDFFSATLPAGFEWPNGQTLASVATNYPEYNAANGSGTTLDLRGRHTITLDNLGGSAAGRIGTIINGTVVGNVGGAETNTLLRTDLPNIALTFSGTSAAINITANNAVTTSGSSGSGFSSGGVYPNLVPSTISGNVTATGNIVVGGSGNSLNGNVAQTAFSNISPAIVCAKILVVE